MLLSANVKSEFSTNEKQAPVKVISKNLFKLKKFSLRIMNMFASRIAIQIERTI
jgi:hypothetical protein